MGIGYTGRRLSEREREIVDSSNPDVKAAIEAYLVVDAAYEAVKNINIKDLTSDNLTAINNYDSTLKGLVDAVKAAGGADAGRSTSDYVERNGLHNTIRGRRETVLANAIKAAVTSLSVFKSTEQTGNASEQSVAHGLGVVPSLVIIVPTKVATAGDTFVEGTHTSTNVLVTASTGAKYKVIAFAGVL